MENQVIIKKLNPNFRPQIKHKPDFQSDQGNLYKAIRLIWYHYLFFKHIKRRMMRLYLALVLMILVTSNSKYFAFFFIF